MTVMEMVLLKTQDLLIKPMMPGLFKVRGELVLMKLT